MRLLFRMHFLALAGLLTVSCGGTQTAQSQSPAAATSQSPAAAKSHPAAAKSQSPATAKHQSPAAAPSQSSAKMVGTTHPQFEAESQDDADATASAKLHLIRGGSEEDVGTLTLVQDGEEVTLSGAFSNLPTGARGIQIHAKSKCNGSVARKSGPHFNPTKAKHGAPESANRHVGDFGNIVVDKDGTASFSMKTDSLSVIKGGPSSVLGRIVVITRRPDDGKTQPDGNVGPAIACGVIK